MILLGEGSDGSISIHDFKEKNNSNHVHLCTKPPLPKIDKKSVFQKVRDKLFKENKRIQIKDLILFGRSKSLADDEAIIKNNKKPKPNFID